MDGAAPVAQPATVAPPPPAPAPAAPAAPPKDAGAAPKPAPPPKVRDEAKMREEAARRAARKLETATKGAKTPEEFFARVADLKDGKKPGKASDKPAELAKRDEPKAATATTNAAPGWPSAEATAAALPLAVKAWAGLATVAAETSLGEVLNTPTDCRVLTRNAAGEVTKVDVVKVDAVSVLAEGTAPLVAQVLGDAGAMTPAKLALVTVAAVLGPWVGEQAMKGGAAAWLWWKSRETEPAANEGATA